MINMKGTVIMAVIAYSVYHYTHTGNLTLIPPTKSAVVQAFQKAQSSRASQYDVEVTKKCTRVGGGMVKEGIYACELEFTSKSGGEQPFIEKILIEKKQGNWVVKNK
ncbi:hypothetical protein QG082_02095 [Kingella kingae]|uniref:hypothetical protein n=1 Tax=Kingella kingae TaxID=504 RepID=UPI000DFEC038|nr:hypothetical protein [Kingella kingae]MDK4527542.1 hypothetical protein [Kingella kingae]MDK4542269.1 hypothetical protein [Kingella kingae]MDK4561647.1 hypothetical protein [Kingella kingae]MDK4602043.1 hypothetical protein [Kingella kingae]MDK4632015.1 hypothetical protein [Kingella kingae]